MYAAKAVCCSYNTNIDLIMVTKNLKRERDIPY